jgi:uncharacterized protein (DUF1778 family)
LPYAGVYCTEEIQTMSALPNPHSARLDFRVSPEHKALIERAANAQGQTVSSFAVATLLKAAEEAIQSETTRTLSARDSQAFLARLSDPPEPNAVLKAAAKRYKASRGR